MRMKVFIALVIMVVLSACSSTKESENDSLFKIGLEIPRSVKAAGNHITNEDDFNNYINRVKEVRMTGLQIRTIEFRIRDHAVQPGSVQCRQRECAIPESRVETRRHTGWNLSM
jgi:hypothetical protein